MEASNSSRGRKTNSASDLHRAHHYEAINKPPRGRRVPITCGPWRDTLFRNSCDLLLGLATLSEDERRVRIRDRHALGANITASPPHRRLGSADHGVKQAFDRRRAASRVTTARSRL